MYTKDTTNGDGRGGDRACASARRLASAHKGARLATGRIGRRRGGSRRGEQPAACGHACLSVRRQATVGRPVGSSGVPPQLEPTNPRSPPGALRGVWVGGWRPTGGNAIARLCGGGSVQQGRAGRARRCGTALNVGSRLVLYVTGSRAATLVGRGVVGGGCAGAAGRAGVGVVAAAGKVGGRRHPFTHKRPARARPPCPDGTGRPRSGEALRGRGDGTRSTHPPHRRHDGSWGGL